MYSSAGYAARFGDAALSVGAGWSELHDRPGRRVPAVRGAARTTYHAARHRKTRYACAGDGLGFGLSASGLSGTTRHQVQRFHEDQIGRRLVPAYIAC